MSNARARLLEVFRSRAFARGKFKLASGKESTYYINSKKALFNSEAVWLLGDVLWDLTMNLDIQAIGGLEIGAIPMATTAVLHHHMHGRTVEGFFVTRYTVASVRIVKRSAEAAANKRRYNNRLQLSGGGA